MQQLPLQEAQCCPFKCTSADAVNAVLCPASGHAVLVNVVAVPIWASGLLVCSSPCSNLLAKCAALPSPGLTGRCSPAADLHPLPCSTAVWHGTALTGPARPQLLCHGGLTPSGSSTQTARQVRSQNGAALGDVVCQPGPSNMEHSSCAGAPCFTAGAQINKVIRCQVHTFSYSPRLKAALPMYLHSRIKALMTMTSPPELLQLHPSVYTAPRYISSH